MWLTVGVGAVVVRTVQLFFVRDVQAGLVWLTKILTDPFHDVVLYYKAPLYLLRGRTDRPDRLARDGVTGRPQPAAGSAPPASRAASAA